MKTRAASKRDIESGLRSEHEKTHVGLTSFKGVVDRYVYRGAMSDSNTSATSTTISTSENPISAMPSNSTILPAKGPTFVYPGRSVNTITPSLLTTESTTKEIGEATRKSKRATIHSKASTNPRWIAALPSITSTATVTQRTGLSSISTRRASIWARQTKPLTANDKGSNLAGSYQKSLKIVVKDNPPPPRETESEPTSAASIASHAYKISVRRLPGLDSSYFEPAGNKSTIGSRPKRESNIIRNPPLSAPKKKKRRLNEGYKSPEVYCHLGGLPDILEKNLICIFVGTNPGLKTAETGHAYSAPSNRFYPLLYSSNLTPGPRKLKPIEDRELPRRFCLGNTNIVERPTRNQAELSLEEMALGVPILEQKIRKYRPEAVCIVGKGVWASIYKWKVNHEPEFSQMGRGKGTQNGMRKELFQWGWQTDRWGDIRMGIETHEEYLRRRKKENWHHEAEEEGLIALDENGDGGDDDNEQYMGAKVFVAPSTSGLVTVPTEQEKRDIFKQLGDWVNERREVRNFVADPVML